METKTQSVLLKEKKIQTKVRQEFSFLRSRAVMLRNTLHLLNNLTLFNKSYTCKRLSFAVFHFLSPVAPG